MFYELLRLREHFIANHLPLNHLEHLSHRTHSHCTIEQSISHEEQTEIECAVDAPEYVHKHTAKLAYVLLIMV